MHNVSNKDIVSGGGELGRGGFGSTERTGDAITYSTKRTCIVEIYEKMAKYPTTRDTTFNASSNYAADYNSWLMSTGYMVVSTQTKNWARCGTKESYFEVNRRIRWNTLEGFVDARAFAGYPTTKEVMNNVAFKIFGAIRRLYDSLTESNQNCCMARVQMERPEKVTEQGDTTQESVKEVNTIITRDKQETISSHVQPVSGFMKYASSEPLHKFDSITKRWMPLDIIEISTDKTIGDNLKTYYLPETLYQDACSPNLNPMETFVYGNYDIEIKAMCSGQKFCVGKVIISSKYDSYQRDGINNGYQSALARNHIILDLSENNTGILKIPFRYHRAFIRNVKNDKSSVGVRPSKYASLYVQILSPFSVGAGAATTMNMRLFWRFTRAEYTGMSYRAVVQMPLGVEDIITPTTSRALKEVLAGAERAFEQLGQSRNQDKPTSLSVTQVVPRPRLNFGSGKGLSDAVPLRVNPYTLTNYQDLEVPNDEPTSFLQLARIWGIRGEATLNTTDSEGQEIIKLIVDPSARDYFADYNGELTPVEYATQNYALWGGTLEFRFDFVSATIAHRALLQFSIEFGRRTPTTNLCESGSTYVKVFQLGDQKSVTITVPYIYDTILRRTTGLIYNPYESTVTTPDIAKKALNVAPLSNTYIKMRVINPLRAVEGAPKSIKILVFMRAGKNYTLRGLKGLSARPSYNIVEMDNFPEAYEPTKPTDKKHRRKREVGEVDHKWLPDGIGNEWNEVKPEKLPYVQMDNGSKEDQDSTEDFNKGISMLSIVSSDDHTNFKDLLRRPTCIIWNKAMTVQSDGGYFIPVMPPSRMMVKDDASGLNNDWVPTLSSTSAVSIMDMFAHWRGSTRYTLVITGAEKKDPVYVSYIPHSGVRIIGDHNCAPDKSYAYPICGANFVTEMIIPSINPTLTVEVPYETENIWTCTFEEDAQRNYAWRDKGDTNAGHLVIKVTEPCNVTVWWQAGDDFEIANFYGIPKCKWNGWAYRYSDDHARVQMDFNLSETMTKVTGLAKKIATPTLLGRTAVSMIPVIGMPLAVAHTVSTLEDQVDRTTDVIRTNVEKIGNLADKLEIGMDNMFQILNDAVAQITNGVPNLLRAADVLRDVIIDIIMAWMEKSWRVIGMSIVRFLLKATNLTQTVIESVWTYGVQIGDFLSNLMSTTEQVRVQVDVDHTATYVGILAGLIGTIYRVQVERGPWSQSFSSSMWQRLTTSTGISYFVQVLRFIQMSFEALKSMILNVMGIVSPEAQALKELSDKSEFIDKFVREAQIMTSESNSGLINLPHYRRRFWNTVLNAHQIQRLLCRVPTNCASYQLSKLCNDVISAGNEKFVDLSATPVRFVPYVVCLEGDSQIGKSYMTEDLAIQLLTEIGVQQPSAENIYYRTAGEKFWSGFRDQQVVVYDEWLNTTDQQRCTEQILEMMKLKTTAMFIPEMAHLDEKKIRGNPLIIIVCTNNAFPNALSNYATYPKATLKRRDLVLHVERLPEYVDKTIEDNPELTVDFRQFKHLRFTKYKDVTDSSSKTAVWQDHPTTVAWIRKHWARYYQVQKEEVKRRMDRIPNYFEGLDGGVKLEDPFTLFYQINTNMVEEQKDSEGWTYYEQLEMAVRTTLGALQVEVEEDQTPVDVPQWEHATKLNGSVQWGGLALSLLHYWQVPKMIAKATRACLDRWIEEIAPRPQIKGNCLVCMEENISCAYVCGQTCSSEIQHLVCIECYYGLIQFGTGTCPMCRDPKLIPVLGENDLAALSVFMRGAICMGRGMQWFCDRICEYYNFRDRHPVYSLFIDYFLAITQVLWIRPNHPPTFWAGSLASRYIHVGWTIYDMWGDLSPIIMGTQSPIEEWDEDPVSQPERNIRTQTDIFQIEINEDALSDLCFKTGKGPCLHDKVRQHIRSVEMKGDRWIVRDDTLRQMIEVPLELCEDCHIEDYEEYYHLIEHYATMRRVQLRALYIRYYNTREERELTAIPLIFRAEWMRPIETGIKKDWWNYVCEFLHTHRNTILYITAAIGVLGVVFQTYRAATAITNTVNAVSQMGATAGSPKRQPRNPKRGIRQVKSTKLVRKARQHFKGPAKNQSDCPTIYEAARDKIWHNTFKLILLDETSDKKPVEMYGTGLFNHYLLVPRHYTIAIRKRMEEGWMLYGHPLTAPQTRMEIRLGDMDIVESEESDLAYIILPPQFRLFKDIRKFCAKDKDFEGEITSDGILFGNPKAGGAEFMREIEVDIFGIETRTTIVDQYGEIFEVQDVLCYGYSKDGACGSILLREKHSRPILSMHFAGIGEGVTGEGYGVLLTQESLGCLMDTKIVPVQFEDKTYETIEDARFVYSDDIHLDYLGSLTPEETPFTPMKSKLVKSAIYGADGLQADVMPAILDKADKRYKYTTTPLYEGVKKHGQITKDIPTDLVNKAGELYWDLYLNQMKPSIARPRELTLEQAIVGIPGMEHYKPMDLNTSAGYPLCLNKQQTSKSDYIEVERGPNNEITGLLSVDERIIRTLEEKRQLRKQGIVPHTLFIDTLKDEKRTIEKALSLGGTRVFCGSPVDYVIECRRYFMHYVATFMKYRGKVCSAVGINPTSDEWTQLTQSLLKHGTEFGTIDYSNFGPGYNSKVAKKAYELIIRWTKQHVRDLVGAELDERELWCIVYECLQSMHVCNNTVYQQGAGSPSGAFFTTIINTMVNVIYILISWLELTEDKCKELMMDPGVAFKKYVTLWCYGDDGIFTVGDEFKKEFNMITIMQYLSEFDIVATDAEKKGVAQEEWEHYTEARFLKRGFLKHPIRKGKWLAPLKEMSIRGCTQWVWQSENRREQAYINALAALMEAYGHGPDYFKKFKDLLNQALVKARCKTVSGDWKYFDDIFFGVGFENTMDIYLLQNLY